MQLKSAKLGVATYLTPEGAIIGDNLQELNEHLKQVGAPGALHLVVDLRQVPFFDSQGLEFLLDLSVSLRESGGSLRLANANLVCRDTLAVTKLDRTIPVFENLETAGRSFL